jgi:hypothetical protein
MVQTGVQGTGLTDFAKECVMRITTGLVLSLALIVPDVASAAPSPPAASHPILGIWKLTLPDGSCSEIYRFRGDGTTLVTSAEEVTESEFAIPDTPSPKGFYRLDDRVVKDNGKKDCVGEVMKPGSKATNYIHFHPSGTLFIMCAAESLDACIGPFRRVQGQDT